MKKKSLRILSLIVAIVMVVSIIPLAALADETGPKRKVGVVVYGAELTTVLTNVESAFHGDVDLEDSLKDLTDTVTKLVDGTGISVPEVDVSLTTADGKTTYKMEEDKSVNIFTDTTEIYIGFQEEVDKQLTKLENDLKGLKQAMAESNQLTQELANQITQFENALTEIREKLNDLKDTLVEDFNSMEGSPNGILYRTYVTEEAVPVGDYTVWVKGFSDQDADGNAITRDGYVLYNDGLESEGSMFNTTRSFSVDITEQGRFDHEIQFVGPLAGIQGELKLPEAFDTAYDNFANVLNKMLTTAEKVKNMTTNNTLVDWAANLIGDATQMKPIYEWFKAWTAPQLSTSDEISKDYRFGFPGLWCDELDAGFSFKNVDVSETGIEGSQFLLINRQELIDILKLMKDIGKEGFEGALKATFGGSMDYTYQEDTITYEGITDLYTQLVTKDDEGQLALDCYDTAYAIVKTYIGVISDMRLIDWVAEKDTSTLIPTYKLKYPIPAILQATSDENGIVTFSKSSNKTLTWMLDIIPQIQATLNDLAGNSETVQNNEILSLLLTVSEYSATMSSQFVDLADRVINLLVYPFAQRLGLVGPKLASGTYIMFQTKAAEGYYINPMAYTMDIEWNWEGTSNDDWYYSTVADLGLIGPYFAEGFYDFVGKTTFAGTLDSVLGKIKEDDNYNVVSDILNGKINLTQKTNQALMGALTAFAAQVGFESLGGEMLFNSKSELIADMNDYLLKTGMTAQNLVVYLNRLAMRSKTVYTGRVDEGWYFYNLDKSPTLTATKLINKSTNDIAKAMEIDAQKNIVQKTGDTVSKVVNKVGTQIETTANKIKTQIKSSIGAAVKSAAQKALDSVKSAVTNFVKNLFSRAGSGMVTFDA